ncbi:MAG TPA: hypothetical protein VGM30_19535 [Puia sp.]
MEWPVPVREGEGDCDRTDRDAATTAMWPPVPHREADEGGRGAATRGRP